MVDFNLIHSLGNLDADVDAAVATALGDAANDLSKLVGGDEVQDFTPGAILKGRISAISGDVLQSGAGANVTGGDDKMTIKDAGGGTIVGRSVAMPARGNTRSRR